VSPTASDFLTQELAIRLVKFGHALEVPWVLCHQGTLPEKRKNVVEAVLLGITVYIPEEVIL
jgi:hypothetical protein